MKFINDTWIIAKKELLQHFKTKRLLVIGVIFAAVMIIFSVYGGYLTGQDQSKPTYEQGAAKVLELVLSFSTFFPAILAISLTYDAIVGERVNNSMYLLISKPIRKESIYIGKFAGAWLAIAAVYTVVLSIGYAIIVGLSGQMPSAGDVGDLYLVIGLILVGVAAWLTLVMFLSSSFKTTASALITAIMVWLFVMSIVSQAGLIYYAVTAPKTSSNVNTGVSGIAWQGGTLVTFAGTSLDAYPENFTTIVTESASGIQVEPAPIPGASQSFYYMTPGYYSWSSHSGKKGNNASGNGTVLIEQGASVQLSLGASDKDKFVNDMSFSFIGLLGTTASGGEYYLVRNGTTYMSGSANHSMMTFKNLTAGWYDFGYSNSNVTVVTYHFYSYGESAGGNELLNILMGEQSNAPGYVKGMYAINPDNCMGAYKYILDSKAKGILTLNESVASLAVFTVVCGALGLLVFRRRDLA